jgi:hypothetical protein
MKLRATITVLAITATLATVIGVSAQDSGDEGWVRVYAPSETAITIDGKPYPRRAEYGMRVAANVRHQVDVKQGDKEKSYTIVVKNGELRTLLVDLTGYQSGPSLSASGGPAGKYKPPASKKADSDSPGKLTVYSKPKGEVFLDGSALGATTPMINREVDLGRHEVQVKWESGDMSEVKTIRIRKGSKLKLFFRDKSNKVK